jgi:hypothetical protein
VLYAHGGAYCLCNAGTHRRLLSYLCLHSGARIIAIDYRRPPEYPHPACRDDMVRAYLHLVSTGTPPESIVFAGDSAGGGLCASAVLYLRDECAKQTLPAGAVLMSPWVDLADQTGGTWDSNLETDIFPNDMAQIFAQLVVGPNGDITNPSVSPIRANLVGLPPLLIEAGGGEVLYGQIERFSRVAMADGVKGIHHLYHMFKSIFYISHSMHKNIHTFIIIVIIFSLYLSLYLSLSLSNYFFFSSSYMCSVDFKGYPGMVHFFQLFEGMGQPEPGLSLLRISEFINRVARPFDVTDVDNTFFSANSSLSKSSSFTQLSAVSARGGSGTSLDGFDDKYSKSFSGQHFTTASLLSLGLFCSLASYSFDAMYDKLARDSDGYVDYHPGWLFGVIFVLVWAVRIFQHRENIWGTVSGP